MQGGTLRVAAGVDRPASTVQRAVEGRVVLAISMGRGKRVEGVERGARPRRRSTGREGEHSYALRETCPWPYVAAGEWRVLLTSR